MAVTNAIHGRYYRVVVCFAVTIIFYFTEGLLLNILMYHYIAVTNAIEIPIPDVSHTVHSVTLVGVWGTRGAQKVVHGYCIPEKT